MSFSMDLDHKALLQSICTHKDPSTQKSTIRKVGDVYICDVCGAEFELDPEIYHRDNIIAYRIYGDDTDLKFDIGFKGGYTITGLKFKENGWMIGIGGAYIYDERIEPGSTFEKMVKDMKN